ncbi:hypothetical protein D3C78_983500 [compost metagenome]
MAGCPEAVQPLIDIAHAGHIDIAHIRDRQCLQPLQHAIPAVVVDERLWVGLVHGVCEQQGNQVIERIDASDSGSIGTIAQKGDLIDALFEQFLSRLDLQGSYIPIWLIER